jgi:hypothetical protein
MASQQSALRIFAVSGVITLVGLVGVLIGLGPAALLTTLILVIIEIVFSFDNAIVNAKVLERMSASWQQAFLTIGMVFSILGMRLLFPLVIVGLAAHMGLGDVWNLALHHPHEYADKLQDAHPLISIFGGAFLVVLSLEFFLNGTHDVLWLQTLERHMRKLRSIWLPAVVTVAAVVLVALLSNHPTGQTMRAGLLGVATFVAVQLFDALLSRGQPKSGQVTGWAAFSLFMYLQVLDASFSFDSVIGAFAITDVVVLIVIGLGIGALWVRSLTVYMVRRGILGSYIYLEHGAYYTIAVLAFALFTSLFVEVPDAITGIIGLGIIGSALAASLQVKKHQT